MLISCCIRIRTLVLPVIKFQWQRKQILTSTIINSMSILIVLYYLIVLSTCTRIEYSETGSRGFKSINITSTVLSDRTISVYTSAIRTVNYYDGDNELSVVTDLPQLRNIYIERVKQRFLPVFINVPNLDTISVERNELVLVTRDRFSALRIVYVFLRFNKLLQIEDGSFGTSVKHVYLACNFLTNIRKEWFQNPNIVNVIDLDDNNIQSIEEDTFKNFRKLEYFYILHNNLKTIGDGAFSGSGFISELSIGFNDLKELRPEIFNRNVTVERLDISYNKLTFLHKELMKKIRLVDSPTIDGNPWQCSCYYHHIRRWLPWKYYEEHKDRPGEPRCVSVLGDFSRRCRTYVSEELIATFLRESSPPPNKKGEFCVNKIYG